MIAKLIMSVLSRFCLNMAANVGLQYAAELLPTPVRSQGVSLIHIFGIVAHSLAPYIIDSVNKFLLLLLSIIINEINLSIRKEIFFIMNFFQHFIFNLLF